MSDTSTPFVIDPYKDDPRWINAVARWDAGLALLNATDGRQGLGQIVSASMDQRMIERIYLNNLQEVLDFFAGWAAEGYLTSDDPKQLDTFHAHLRNLELALGVTSSVEVLG